DRLQAVRQVAQLASLVMRALCGVGGEHDAVANERAALVIGQPPFPAVARHAMGQCITGFFTTQSQGAGGGAHRRLNAHRPRAAVPAKVMRWRILSTNFLICLGGPFGCNSRSSTISPTRKISPPGNLQATVTVSVPRCGFKGGLPAGLPARSTGFGGTLVH